MEGPAADEAERRLDELERGVEEPTQERVAVFGSTADDPEKHFLNWQQDPYSNYVARATFADKVRELRIEIDLVTELAVYNPFDFFLEPDAEHFPFTYEPRLLRNCSRSCGSTWRRRGSAPTSRPWRATAAARSTCWWT